MHSVDIMLLTQDDCSSCDDAKRLLDRLGAEYPLDVRTVDLTTPEGEQLASASGVMFPPGILIDGEPFSYGRPSERKLRKALERRLVGT